MIYSFGGASNFRELGRPGSDAVARNERRSVTATRPLPVGGSGHPAQRGQLGLRWRATPPAHPRSSSDHRSQPARAAPGAHSGHAVRRVPRPPHRRHPFALSGVAAKLSAPSSPWLSWMGSSATERSASGSSASGSPGTSASVAASSPAGSSVSESESESASGRSRRRRTGTAWAARRSVLPTRSRQVVPGHWR